MEVVCRELYFKRQLRRHEKGLAFRCFAQQKRAAIIVESSFVGGALTYKIEARITQTRENSQQANSQSLVLTASVKRTNAEDHPDGLVIDQLVARAQ